MKPTDQPLSSSLPYLLRAMHEWIVDNGMTPHLLVDANAEGVTVPTEHVENGNIVLNAGPTAVRDLNLGNDWISFSARFSGTPFDIFVPVAAIEAIYARENGQGMYFGEPAEGITPDPVSAVQAHDADDDEPPKPTGGRPNLKVVK